MQGSREKKTVINNERVLEKKWKDYQSVYRQQGSNGSILPKVLKLFFEDFNHSASCPKFYTL
jgi:hypothetical protein